MRVYSDAGNEFVADQVPQSAKRILDIGCGSGDTAKLIKRRIPGAHVEGITYNAAEARAADEILDRVHTFDIEQDLPAGFGRDFDVLLFSHIVEHLRSPRTVVRRFLPHLVDGGKVIIAVPNLLEWRTRLQLLRGRFAYDEHGVLDRTHLRFFTFNSADGELLNQELAPLLVLEVKRGAGAVPLGPLRRLLRMRRLADTIDALGVRYFPNLFSQQVVLVARKRGGGA